MAMSAEESAEEINFDDLNTENLALAAAIGARTVNETNLQAEILTSLVGIPVFEATRETRAQARIGWTAVFLSRLDDPERDITLGDVAEQMLDAKSMRAVADFTKEMDAEIEFDPDRLREMMVASIKSAEQSGTAVPMLAEGFNRELEAARALAAEKGVSTAEVYETDDLYYEVKARTQTPDELAGLQMALVNQVEGLDFDSLITKLAGNTAGMNPVPGVDFGETLRMLEDNPVMKALIEDQLKSYMETFNESNRQAFLYTLVRRYGYESINDLSEEQRDVLLPKAEKLHDVVAEAIRNSK
jgi:hypothetical protein